MLNILVSHTYKSLVASISSLNMIRILFITQYFWPENFRINDLVQGLSKLGHSVTVLTGKPNYPYGRFFEGYSFLGRKREQFDNVDVVRVPMMARGNGSRLALA